jgi:threonine-phosphate decarboxylase
MKSPSELARETFRDLKPCVHGADTFDAADISGFKREDILDFSSSVNPLGASQKALDAAKQAFSQIPSYPDSTSAVLREAVAKHYGIGSGNVVVGNGSTELIYLFAEAFLQKGDVALVPAPSFGEYESAVCRAGGKAKFVKFKADFQANPENFIQAMGGKVKLVYFCNPNNPTSIITAKEDLIEIVHAASDRNIMFFLDEDFLEFVDDGEKHSLISRIGEFPNLFVLRSFTKIYGLTGLRVGYGIASKEVTSILSNAKIPWNVNCLAQAAAVAALHDEVHLQKTLALVKQEKAFLLKALAGFVGLRVFPPDANFFFIDVRKTGLTAAEVKAKMLKRGVLIRDCTSFAGLDQYFIRVAVKTRAENVKLLEAFKQVFGV